MSVCSAYENPHGLELEGDVGVEKVSRIYEETGEPFRAPDVGSKGVPEGNSAHQNKWL